MTYFRECHVLFEDEKLLGVVVFIAPDKTLAHFEGINGYKAVYRGENLTNILKQIADYRLPSK